MSVLRIGVVGFGGIMPSHRAEAIRLLHLGLDTIQADHPGATDIWIVSGLVNLSLPGLAYGIAKERGWKTSGIASSRIIEEDFECFPVDEQQIVDDLAKERDIFLASIDVMLRIWGGKETHDWTAEFASRGGTVYGYPLPKG